MIKEIFISFKKYVLNCNYSAKGHGGVSSLK